jgi:hypothetical protein
MEARLALVVVALFVSASTGGATVVNVKNYGAKGNSVNDDTKVGVFFVSFFFSSSPIRAPAATLIHRAYVADVAACSL